VEIELSDEADWFLSQMQVWAVNGDQVHRVVQSTLIGNELRYYVEIEQLLEYLHDAGGSVGGEPDPARPRKAVAGY
jgi:hypothetical protein